MTSTHCDFHLFLIEDFFEEQTCRDLISQMRQSPCEPALTYGTTDSGVLDENVRRVARVKPPRDTFDLVTQRIMGVRSQIGSHFGIELGACEEPQFLCYRVGDFFVAHQDGNTGMLRLSTEARRISISIFLNSEVDAPAPGAYCGGSLGFHDWRRDQLFRLKGNAGTLVAFRSEVTHEVRPVTIGQRYAIVTWFW